MNKTDYSFVVAAYLLLTTPAGGLIGLLIRNAGKDVLPADEGSRRMGLWIGCTERFIILTFVLANHYDAVGLLVAAKSILRVSDQQARKQTEYVLLGTLLSLAIAVAIGEALKLLIPSLAVTK